MLPMERGPMRAGCERGRTISALYTVKKLPCLERQPSCYYIPCVKDHENQVIAGMTALQQT